jgi:Glyoxalase-like domain
MSIQWTLMVDCADPATLAAFWGSALGYRQAAPPAGFDSWTRWFIELGVPEAEWNDGAAIEDPAGIRPRISFLKVPEGKATKNRLHLDLQVGGGRAEPWDVRWSRVTAAVQQLLTNGATVIREVPLDDGRPDHVVMADPEGNEFCVV